MHLKSSSAEVGDWMTPMVVTIPKSTTIGDALAMLRDENVSSLPVVGEHGEFVGIVTITDFLRAMAASGEVLESSGPHRDDYQWMVEMVGRQLGSNKVTSLMTDVVATVRPDHTMHEAAGLLLNNNLHHLAVCKSNGELVGILSSTDFVRFAREV